jgi:hypothetical protein
MRPPLRLPSARQSSAFRDSSRRLSGSRTHATVEPSTVTGQREAASLSRRARSKFSESHCERPRRTVRTSEPVRFRSPRAFAKRAVCGAIRLCSHAGPRTWVTVAAQQTKPRGTRRGASRFSCSCASFPGLRASERARRTGTGVAVESASA